MAEQLAAIAQFYRFDGWLVNIENSLSVSHTFPPPPCPWPSFPALSL